MNQRWSGAALIDLSPAMSGYLAIAVQDLRSRLRVDGHREPPGLSELQDLLTLRARTGQDEPIVDELAIALQHLVNGERTPQLLTDLAGAAAALKVHERTVKRLAHDKTLRAVHLGRALRFRWSDLRDFVNGLE